MKVMAPPTWHSTCWHILHLCLRPIETLQSTQLYVKCSSHWGPPVRLQRCRTAIAMKPGLTPALHLLEHTV